MKFGMSFVHPKNCFDSSDMSFCTQFHSAKLHSRLAEGRPKLLDYSPIQLTNDNLLMWVQTKWRLIDMYNPHKLTNSSSINRIHGEYVSQIIKQLLKTKKSNGLSFMSICVTRNRTKLVASGTLCQRNFSKGVSGVFKLFVEGGGRRLRHT